MISLPVSQAPLRRNWAKPGNTELVDRYREWLICQRYSRTTHEVYNRVVGKFLNFWGLKSFAGVSHLDVRQFIAESSSRDLSGEVVHRYLWALRSFFHFLCIHGVVDEVAPRLVRSRPAKSRCREHSPKKTFRG